MCKMLENVFVTIDFKTDSSLLNKLIKRKWKKMICYKKCCSIGKSISYFNK